MEKNSVSFLGDMLAAFKSAAFKKLWPFAVITVVYLVIYTKVMSGYHEAARHASDVTPFVYLFTQFTAWWHYVFNWFAPVNLIADDLSYPVFRSLFAPEVLLAIAGGLLVIGLLLRLYPRYPYLIFLAVSALALLSPTSSFLPLAEMVNEHRPYLPIALFSLTWLLPAGLLAPAAARRYRPAGTIAAAGFALLVAAFFTLTFQRNRVFSSEKAYYWDIIKKAPSSRAYVNYGLTLMREGRNDEALKYCRSALELAPNWHVVHINLGILYQLQGDIRQAQYHFDRAVATEQYSAYSLVYRAEFRLAQRMYAPALDDLGKCLPMTREFFRVYKDMATATAGLGDWEKSLAYTKKCFAIDPHAAELEIVGISRPFWDTPAGYAAGIGYYQGVDSLYPGQWWVFQNIGDLAGKTGQPELARKSFGQATRLRQEDSLRKAGGVLGK
jgi:tetratricopeptide (TPR) repeat protein